MLLAPLEPGTFPRRVLRERPGLGTIILNARARYSSPAAYQDFPAARIETYPKQPSEDVTKTTGGGDTGNEMQYIYIYICICVVIALISSTFRYSIYGGADVNISGRARTRDYLTRVGGVVRRGYSSCSARGAPCKG